MSPLGLVLINKDLHGFPIDLATADSSTFAKERGAALTGV